MRVLTGMGRGLRFWMATLLFLLWQPSLTLSPEAAGRLPQSPGLVVDKDTVFGGPDHGYSLAGPWNNRLRIAVKNTRGQSVRFDSIRYPRDSMKTGNYSEPLTLVFGCWPRPANGQLLSHADKSGLALPLGPAIVIAAGDSIEIGMFEIGHASVLVKQSAAERSVPLGDSVSLPVLLFGNGDSLSLVVRAKIRNFSYGSGIRAPRIFARVGGDLGALGWSVDGRNLSVTAVGRHYSSTLTYTTGR